MRNILVVFGTRPEAIKLCPLILHLRRFYDDYHVSVCVTAQHRRMLDQVLAAFDLTPDFDLNVMQPGQSLFQSTSRIMTALEQVLESCRPDIVIVQGDTTSTLCGALAAFYKRVPVGHVEAGLRTGDLGQPFPEEMNRVLTTRLASLHFAATEGAAENLRREGVEPSRVSVSGNTVIDALRHVVQGLDSGRLRRPAWPWLDASRRLIVVTAHRRESFGNGFEGICRAVADLAKRNDVQIAWPVHPNPMVQDPVNRILRGLPEVHLLEPLEYVPFIDLLRRAYLILTDSGGVQEEAPSLGKPILVLRDKTERPEAVAAGAAMLVGSEPDRILKHATGLLDNPREYNRPCVHNPYGDGRACGRIEDAIRSFFKGNSWREQSLAALSSALMPTAAAEARVHWTLQEVRPACSFPNDGG